jgi:hypothetical protein
MTETAVSGLSHESEARAVGIDVFTQTHTIICHFSVFSCKQLNNLHVS